MKLVALFVLCTFTLIASPMPALAARADVHETRVVSAKACSPGAFVRARALLNAHQYRAAQTGFQEAIRCNDHVTAAYANLGTANFDLGQYVAAFAAYRAAQARSPKDPALSYVTGYAALYASKWRDAVKYATLTLALSPKSDVAHHLRFLAYGRMLNRKAQLHDASAEVHLKPSNPDYWDDVGIALYNNSKLEQSISAFSHAIQLKPGQWSYFKNRAISELYAKKPKSALKDFETAERMAPAGSEKKQLQKDIAILKKKLHQ